MSKGIILLLIAELFFALGTVIVKIITNNTEITGVELAFLRFFTGFVIISSYVIFRKKSVKPVKSIYVYMRALFNTMAVVFFFMGVQYSNVSKANLLNMTYPVFVMMLSPLINRERARKSMFLFLIIIMAGVYLIVIPGYSGSGFSNISKGDIFALLSGITAGFAISFLREARKTNSIHVIIFYLMGIGTLVSGIFAAKSFIIPSGIYIFYILIMATISFAGQLMITFGYRYIDAAPGSLISSSRIIFALIFGVTLFSDPVTTRIIAGSLMIIISLAGVNGLFRYLKKKIKDKRYQHSSLI